MVHLCTAFAATVIPTVIQAAVSSSSSSNNSSNSRSTSSSSSISIISSIIFLRQRAPSPFGNVHRGGTMHRLLDPISTLPRDCTRTPHGDKAGPLGCGPLALEQLRATLALATARLESAFESVV